MANERPDKTYGPLGVYEWTDVNSEVTWRARMWQESRKQTLLLERLVILMETNGRTLEQIRTHFEHWEVQE